MHFQYCHSLVLGLLVIVVGLVVVLLLVSMVPSALLATTLLVGVAELKLHGKIAGKVPNNYVYDDDDSIKFPHPEPSKDEIVCASKSPETKKDTATPKITGSQKQGHWILDKKNKQLTRVHITPRKALFTPSGA